MSEEQVKEAIEQIGYQEFYRYYQEKDILIEQQKQEIERLNNIIKKYEKMSFVHEIDLQNRIDKAIEYIETHQLNFKKNITTFGSERLSMEERKLLDILRGDKE